MLQGEGACLLTKVACTGVTACDNRVKRENTRAAEWRHEVGGLGYRTTAPLLLPLARLKLKRTSSRSMVSSLLVLQHSFRYASPQLTLKCEN